MKLAVHGKPGLAHVRHAGLEGEVLGQHGEGQGRDDLDPLLGAALVAQPVVERGLDAQQGRARGHGKR